ncbi:MAG: Stk1 family PASTA domain-containing Ser/Thr kinase [Ruminococcaceae bacterium]|nr:Stk1 family PASTA domain-containing Ser/Thr kinase [Oscillospiraceae bacterium]
MDKYTGKKLDGRYEIRELIGVGGMANVYHCYDTIDDREVAIKILKDEFLDNEDFIRRFKNESKAIAVLNHPNIVRVYDVSFGDMIQYIVMEYIDGITLKEYIEMQGVLDWKETLHLTTQILKALQHAHENGIVHRDIKPQNIMLLQDGTIKVTDFGIARFSSNATRTMTEQAIGSVHYIAPEQARGDKTDGKTDIYSVGVMMYEMLTGRLPFDADSAVSVALMQLQTTPKRPRQINPEIPAGLEEITIKAMQKTPESRYHSAVVMLSDIERFRLNPSISFEYKYFEEKTGYSDAVKRSKKAHDDKYNDITDDYDDSPVKSPVLSAIKGVIIAAVLVLIVFGGLALFTGYKSAQPKEVDVPDFVGMSVSDANNLNKGQFVFEYESRYSDEFDVDTIIYQTPEAGSKKIKEGSTIQLVVNSSDSDIAIPYVGVNGDLDTTVEKIKEVNLVPVVLYVSSEKEEQTVDSIFPPVGSQVKIGSTVYIFVSKGSVEDGIEMPDLTGKSAYEAQVVLEELGFDNIKVAYDEKSKAEKDTVIRQNPVTGSVVESDYGIVLTCSKGEKDEKEATIYVDLPANVSKEVDVKVLVDGAVDKKYSKTVIPLYNSTYTIKVKGTEVVKVVVLLDDKEYREYSIDYDEGYVTTVNAYNYVDTSATEPPAAPTESPTQEDDEG